MVLSLSLSLSYTLLHAPVLGTHMSLRNASVRLQLIRQQGIVIAAHNAIRDSILETAALADHFVQAEATELYGGPTRVGGVVEREEGQGIISSSINNRVAFDVYTCSDPARVAMGERVKTNKHAANV